MRLPSKRAVCLTICFLLAASSFFPGLPWSLSNLVTHPSQASTPSGYWGKAPTPSSTIDSVSVSSSPNGLGVTVAALAGLEDRTLPVIYYTSNAQDVSWLSYIKQTYGISSTSRSIQYIIQHYAPDFSTGGHIRIIEYNANDPEFPMQLDMARTLAGVDNALVVDSNDVAQVMTWLPTAIVYINVGANSCNAGPDPRLKCFNWLWSNTSNATTRSVFAIPNNGRQQSSDYYVQEKMFEFAFTCAPGKTNCLNALNGTGSGCTINTCETTFTNYILRQYTTPNTPVMGFFGLGGEVGTISLLSSHQLLMTANEEFSNLGFMSGFPTLTGLSQQPPTFIVYNPAKVYIMFQITQGDALFYDGYYNMATWNATDPSNGLYYRTEFSTDWQINPMLAQLAPPIIKYYYATQNFLVDFSTGPSAGGYTHPDLLPNENSFGALANQWATNVNIGEHFIITSSLSTATLQAYATAAQPNDILLWNQHHTPQNQILNSNNVSAMFASFWTPSIQSFSQTDVTNEINQIKASAVGTHFVYVIMNAQNPGLPFIKQVLAGLPSNYVDVRADQYSCLFRQSQNKECAGAPSPPSYRVSITSNTTTAQVGHNISITGFANLDVGTTPYSINLVKISPQPMGYVIPLWNYPSPTKRWDDALAIHNQYPNVPMTIIVDQGNGAGTSTDPLVAGYINAFRAAHITVIGYVIVNQSGTGCCTRNLIGSDPVHGGGDQGRGVEQAIDAWASFYTLDGIFFDNGAWGNASASAGSAYPGHTLLQYMKAASAYAKNTYGYKVTWANSGGSPGQATSAGFIGSVNVINSMENPTLQTAGTVHTYSTGLGGVAAQWSQWAKSQSTAPTVAYLNSISNYTQWIYSSDAGNYQGEPSYQNTTMARLASINSAFTTVATCAMGTSCNVNFTSSVPAVIQFQANIGGASNSTGTQADSQILTLTWQSSPPPPPMCPTGNISQPYVCISADNSLNPVTVNTGTNVLLTATVYNLPTNQTIYSIEIIDLSNSTTIALCPSGLTCSVSVVSNSPFTDSYDAELEHN